MRRISISLISLITAMGSVHAEVTLNAQGEGVMVNQGAGFANTSGEAVLKTGDLISIRRQSTGAAELVYEDRCVVKIKPGDVMRVAKSSPCSFRAQATDPQGDTRPTDQAPVEQLGGVNPGYVIVGGALVAAAAAGIVVATNSKSSNTNQFLPILPPPCASAGC